MTVSRMISLLYFQMSSLAFFFPIHHVMHVEYGKSFIIIILKFLHISAYSIRCIFLVVLSSGLVLVMISSSSAVS